MFVIVCVRHYEDHEEQEFPGLDMEVQDIIGMFKTDEQALKYIKDAGTFHIWDDVFVMEVSKKEKL